MSSENWNEDLEFLPTSSEELFDRWKEPPSSSRAGGEETEDCCICYSEMDERNSHELECGHKFHTACILTWFRTGQHHKACPLCRLGPTGQSAAMRSMQARLSRPHPVTVGRIRLEWFKRNMLNDPPEQLVTLSTEHDQIVASIAREKMQHDAYEARYRAVHVGRKKNLRKEYRRLRSEYEQSSKPLVKEMNRIDAERDRHKYLHDQRVNNLKVARRSKLWHVGMMPLPNVAIPSNAIPPAEDDGVDMLEPGDVHVVRTRAA